ncbi:MAG: RidA family protein [Chitinophagaceae bacterium]|nr:RidA family protein [Chitinophagaceae bacterium]
MNKTIIRTADAPAPIGPYSQAVLTGNQLFISGQVCIIPATGDLNNATIHDETHQVMQNLLAILEAAGMDFSNVVKTSIFLTDMNRFAEVNEVYGQYFTTEEDTAEPAYPARETVQVSALPKFVNVEISMIAVKP